MRSADLLPEGSITGEKIEVATIQSFHLAQGSVSGGHLAGDAVDGRHIRSDSITLKHLAEEVRSADLLPDGSITEENR